MEVFSFLKDEEALVSHRLTHLGGGNGITSSTLTYSIMQSRRRANKNKKHLLNLKDLLTSKSIGLKEYLKLASSMVGKVVGQSINVQNVDRTIRDGYLFEKMTMKMINR